MKIRIFSKQICVSSLIKVALVIITGVLVLGLGLLVSRSHTNDSANFEEIPYTSATAATKEIAIESPLAETSTAAPQTLRVYITGQVKTADVYFLPPESLVVDILNLAGGPTEEADLTEVNLAYPLSDNMMIRIPAKNDIDKKWLIDSGASLYSAAQESSSETNASKKININTAGITDLCTLPGIGESTAQKIINYRTEHGPFKQIEDITKVSGIKEARFQDIKNYITV